MGVLELAWTKEIIDRLRDLEERDIKMYTMLQKILEKTETIQESLDVD